MSTDRRGRGDGRTIEDSADEEPGKISLLSEVEPVRDLRGVGVGGPRRSPVASRHGSDGYKEGELDGGAGGRGIRGRDGGEKALEGR